MKLRHLLAVAALILSVASAHAKSGHSSGSHTSKSSTTPTTHHSGGTRLGTVAPGTGSKLSSERVSGYNKKDGTHVDAYRRSTPDKTFNNNWSTKGNVNLATRNAGLKVTPEKKK